MLDLNAINAEIEKLENCKTSYDVVEKLLPLYVARDHIVCEESVSALAESTIEMPICEESAMPGKKNAMNWLSAKIAELSALPMTSEIAQKLAMYHSAHQALTDTREMVATPKKQESTGSLTMDDAKNWAENIVNTDGTTGPHWTMENTKQVQAQRNIGGDPVEFYAAMNATYSDLSQFFRRHGMNSMDVYVDYVKTFWLNDEDAVDDKVKAYYDYVVKH